MISEDRKREKNKKKIHHMSKKIEIQVGNQIISDDREREKIKQNKHQRRVR